MLLVELAVHCHDLLRFFRSFLSRGIGVIFMDCYNVICTYTIVVSLLIDVLLHTHS